MRQSYNGQSVPSVVLILVRVIGLQGSPESGLGGVCYHMLPHVSVPGCVLTGNTARAGWEGTSPLSFLLSCRAGVRFRLHVRRQHSAGGLGGYSVYERHLSVPTSAPLSRPFPHTAVVPQVSVSSCTFGGNTALMGGGLFVSSGSRCRDSAGCYRLVVDAGTVFRGEGGLAKGRGLPRLPVSCISL